MRRQASFPERLGISKTRIADVRPRSDLPRNEVDRTSSWLRQSSPIGQQQQAPRLRSGANGHASCRARPNVTADATRPRRHSQSPFAPARSTPSEQLACSRGRFAVHAHGDPGANRHSCASCLRAIVLHLRNASARNASQCRMRSPFLYKEMERNDRVRLE